MGLLVPALPKVAEGQEVMKMGLTHGCLAPTTLVPTYIHLLYLFPGVNILYLKIEVLNRRWWVLTSLAEDQSGHRTPETMTLSELVISPHLTLGEEQGPREREPVSRNESSRVSNDLSG